MENSLKSIAGFEIQDTIHDAVEGVIYRAVDKSSGNRVFIKKYYPSLIWSEEVINEFFNLISYLRFFEHEYLLSILDVGKHENAPYVVFADDSFTLLRHRQGGQVTQRETLNFLFRVAEALDFLHAQEIIHGGLDINNIALDPNGYPLLFDFGLSGVFKKLLLENMDDGFENLSIASLTCASPEQILGRTLTRASDVYTFGIIGFHYIFGKFPFTGKYTAETAAIILERNVLQAVALPESISFDVIQFLQKCIQVNPEERFSGFPLILKTLERMKSGNRVRFKFEKRFEVEKPARSIRVSFVPVGVTGLIAISLIAMFYLFIRNTQAFPLSIRSTEITSTSTEPAATQTQTLILGETPAESAASIQSSPTPVQPNMYKLAFEGEKPLDVSEAISLANLGNLREISRLGFGRPEEADVAPDDDHIAVATSAGVIIFEGNQLLKWIDPQGWATSVQFSPDGVTLAIGLRNGEIQLWDWQAGTKTATLAGHTKKINRILFSQNGLLYSASADQNIIVWNLNSNQAIHRIPAHSRAVNDIAVTSDARILVSCSDDQLIRVWDLASASKLYELKNPYFTGSIKAIAISSDDAYLAAGGESGYLYQWNLITTQFGADTSPQRRTDIVPIKQRIWSLEYIRNNQALLVGVDDGNAITYDATRQEYGGVSLSFEIPRHSLKLVEVFGPEFSFDSFSAFRGNNIISANWDGQVTFEQSQFVSGMYDLLDRLDFSPDGTILAAGGRRGSTHVWNLATNEPIYKNLYFLPFGDPISPDGSSIALIVPKSIQTTTAVLTEEIYQMKILTGSQSTRDLSQTLPNANVGYTNNGSIFIAANLTGQKAWDSSSGSETRLNGYPYTGCWVTASATNIKDILQVNSAAGLLPPGDEEHINSLCPKTYQHRGSHSAFSKDLTLMAYLGSSGLLEGYDVIKKSPAWPPYRLDNSEAVTVLAVSPEGSMVAVGDTSGFITFFNGKTGEFISKIVGNFGTLYAIEFSDDGKLISTAGSDGIARIFGIAEIK
ncbi:MAG: protein kinase [Chloroflexi bacterium]|nr:protein kinase [Chloroflexota bacterium]